MDADVMKAYDYGWYTKRQWDTVAASFGSQTIYASKDKSLQRTNTVQEQQAHGCSTL